MSGDPLTTFEMPRDPTPYVQRILSTNLLYARWTHAESAEQFALLHANSIRFSRDTRQWFFWNGQRWELCTRQKIQDAIRIFLGLYALAALRDSNGTAGFLEQRRICTSGFYSGTWAFFRYKQEFYIEQSPVGGAS